MNVNDRAQSLKEFFSSISWEIQEKHAKGDYKLSIYRFVKRPEESRYSYLVVMYVSFPTKNVGRMKYHLFPINDGGKRQYEDGGNPLSLEEVLEYLTEEEKVKFLYHLDLFV